MVTALVKNKKTWDQVRLYLKNNNVETKLTFYQVHRMPAFYSKKTLPTSSSTSKKSINLPSTPNLSKSNIKYIYKPIVKAIKQLNYI